MKILETKTETECIELNNIITQLGFQLFQQQGYKVDELGVVGKNSQSNIDEIQKTHTETWYIPQQPYSKTPDVWYIMDPREKFIDYINEITHTLNTSGIDFEEKELPKEYVEIPEGWLND